ncbi:hypothetical protein OCU04_004609 [Sclerotinia nivalis]|uniref:Uncharacterized protein n=1 Tax=Sclerotinia nivalis TaxID=352851 RepID=A0A9X0DKT5_9HELO|nr:hypothetical protein OCU04_004609 [Sclerotinia nivalis]
MIPTVYQYYTHFHRANDSHVYRLKIESPQHDINQFKHFTMQSHSMQIAVRYEFNLRGHYRCTRSINSIVDGKEERGRGQNLLHLELEGILYSKWKYVPATLGILYNCFVSRLSFQFRLLSI